MIMVVVNDYSSKNKPLQTPFDNWPPLKKKGKSKQPTNDSSDSFFLFADLDGNNGVFKFS